MSNSEKRNIFKVIDGGKVPEVKKGEKISGVLMSIDEREIRADSKIEEEKIFELEEILRHIKEVAKREGLDDNHLKITQEVRNENGDLILLTVEIRYGQLNNLQRNEGWGEVRYDYMIKGVHGNDSYDSTIITKSNEEEIAEIAEYINGDWKYYVNENKNK